MTYLPYKKFTDLGFGQPRKSENQKTIIFERPMINTDTAQVTIQRVNITRCDDGIVRMFTACVSPTGELLPDAIGLTDDDINAFYGVFIPKEQTMRASSPKRFA